MVISVAGRLAKRRKLAEAVAVLRPGRGHRHFSRNLAALLSDVGP